MKERAFLIKSCMIFYNFCTHYVLKNLILVLKDLPRRQQKRGSQGIQLYMGFTVLGGVFKHSRILGYEFHLMGNNDTR